MTSSLIDPLFTQSQYERVVGTNEWMLCIPVAGPRVGIAVGVLLLGLLLGAGLVLLVQRLHGTRRDDTTLELVPRMR